MTDLTRLTLKQARKGLEDRQFSALELTEAHIARMESERGLNAYILETPELALMQAKTADENYAKRQAKALEGLPIANKDLFCTKGIQTTAGSKMLKGYEPVYESTVTQNLLDAGVVTLGKLNMDEFAMGSANMTSAYGPVINPWTSLDNSKQYVPGGSSGGSVAAVAGHLALAATASDTGGSIRQPAAFCGLVGIKPTYGLCSRYGMVAFASSLDQAGVVCKTVEDAAILLEVIASYDSKDSTSLNVSIPHYSDTMTRSVKGLRVGIPKEYGVPGMDPEMVDFWNKGQEWLREAGAEIVEVSLPHTKYALPTYYIIAPAEASSNLARYDGIRYGLRVPGDTLDEMYENTRAEGFGPEVKRRILMGTYVLSAGYYDAYYMKAQRLKRLIWQDFKDAFTHCDVIFSPTTPTTAFAFGEEPKDPVSMYMNDVLTVPANIAGLPGISVPGGVSKAGLPIGLQFIGPALSETMLFNFAAVIEDASNFIAVARERNM